MSQFQPSQLISPIWNESIQPAGTDLARAAVKIPVDVALTERRIYAYIEIAQAAPSAYEMQNSIELIRNRTVVAALPFCISGNAGTNANRSILCLINAGGSPVGDSMVLRLASPFDVNFPTVVLQPFRANAEIDTIQLKLGRVSGLFTGIRTFLACASTKY